MAIGRPRTCECGECGKCKRREYIREWYQRKSLEERRAYIAKRDPEKVRANERARYQRNKEKRAALNKWWASTPEGKESKLRTQREWRKRNPEKMRAHKLVRRAIDRGELFRQPCLCGNPKSEAHHEDYSKPLEVEWLCRKCHHDRHNS